MVCAHCGEEHDRHEDAACGCGCLNGQCVQQVCTPGTRQCNNKIPQTCQNDGCGWTDGQPCACCHSRLGTAMRSASAPPAQSHGLRRWRRAGVSTSAAPSAAA